MDYSENGLVRVKGVPLCSAYPDGATAVCPVLFEVDMAEPPTSDRIPFVLCVVLDKSGSMQGAKLRAAKAALHAIIDALSENDVLHLVIYDSEAKTVLQNATKASASDAHDIVSSITAGGATNIESGLRHAEEVLSNSDEGEGGKRIFLLSDGQATAGFCNTEDLKHLAAKVRDGGVVISTFGIGQDFDEVVMKAMAESGRGSYFFLRESVIRQTIEDALFSLQRTVGVSATIHVESIPPHGRLTRIYRPLDSEDDSREDSREDSDDDDTIETSGELITPHVASVIQTGTGTVWVGDLQAGGHKQQLIEAQLSLPLDLPLGQEVEILRYECRFLQPGSGVEVRVPGTVSIVVGDCDAQMPQVQVAHVMQQLGPRQEEFIQLMDDGEPEQAVAVQLQIIQELEAVQELDTRGYVTAQIRRFRRVLQRVQDNRASNTQARLMVGEAIQRTNSGDLNRLNSPTGSPRRTYRLPLFESPTGSPSPTYRRPRFESPIDPPSPTYRRPRFHQDETFADLSTPTFPAFAEQPLWWQQSPNEAFAGLSTPPYASFAEQPPPFQLSLEAPFIPAMLPPFIPALVGPSLSSQQLTPTQDSVLPLQDAPVLLSEPEHLLSGQVDPSRLPSEFFCPITHQVMTDPVMALDGHTYERLAIERWFREGNRTSPKTGEQMFTITLIPNHAMRAQIMSANESAASCDACEAPQPNCISQ